MAGVQIMGAELYVTFKTGIEQRLKYNLFERGWLWQIKFLNGLLEINSKYLPPMKIFL